MNFIRSSGILLHPTSLPGRFGIGDFGGEAYRFVDFLKASGQTLWQILPLGPPTFGNSPYQCFSAFAGNTLMISPDQLVEMGLLAKADLNAAPDFPEGRIGWGRVTEFKNGLLGKAVNNYRRGQPSSIRKDLDGFRHYAAAWLSDYALFSALKDENGGREWNTWEAGVAKRAPKALADARKRLKDQIEAHELLQYIFFRQWLQLKEYANEKGVKIIGDMPIFVAHNSADVWAHPELFKLDAEMRPAVVAGVPPDYFSATGQLWGNPLYDWDQMRAGGFQWWISRVRETLKVVDIIRIDHFRGFAATWEVPAEDETAENGEWVEVPGREFFEALKKSLGDLPVLAEDLGTITPDVIKLRDELGLPGMRVLQFAFSAGPKDTHMPHNYVRNTVVYTGTHDNDTVVGWFNSSADENSARDAEHIERERDYAMEYLNTDGSQINWDFIRAALASVADIAIIQLQDVLGLDSSARMNIPASEEGNWGWRFKAGMLKRELSEKLIQLTGVYGRTVSPK